MTYRNMTDEQFQTYAERANEMDVTELRDLHDRLMDELELYRDCSEEYDIKRCLRLINSMLMERTM